LKYLGLDYGAERIGVALSEGGAVWPRGILRHKGWGPDVRQVKALMEQTGAQAVVLGLPRNMDGSLGCQARETQGFGERLRQEGVAVCYQDERLSSVEAEEALRAGGLDSRRIRGKVDETAACFILRRYLDSLGYNE